MRLVSSNLANYHATAQKGTKTVLLEVARETIGSIKTKKKKEMDI